MTTAKWPMSQHSQPGEVGGFLNFYAQPFELYVDNRSALTSGNQSTGTQGGAVPSVRDERGDVHNITLPYVNTVVNETSTWDTGNSNDYLNRTDADTGFVDQAIDFIGDIYDLMDFGYKVQTDNMDVSNAGFKGPVLRQRHYTYNMINRSGTEEEGKQIASIARAFQASVYPKMSAGVRIADNVVMPPPMWTITYSPGPDPEPNPNFEGRHEPYDGMTWAPVWFPTVGFINVPVEQKGGGYFRHRGENPNHPSISQAGNNAWRWNMDPFTSVLVNVSLSPTSATDAIQVPTESGWPLVTVMKLSFLEVDQALANQSWDAILPYSWVQDEDSKFFQGKGAGGGGGIGGGGGRASGL